MKTNKISSILFLAVVLTGTMSFADAPVSTASSIYSAVVGDYINANYFIGDTDKVTIQVSDPERNDVAVSIDGFAEAYSCQMYGPYSDPIPTYMMLYRLDVYVSNSVFFKGGFLGLADVDDPAYLNSITIQSSFSGSFSSEVDYYQSPGYSGNITNALCPAFPAASTNPVQNQTISSPYEEMISDGHRYWYKSLSYEHAQNVNMNIHQDRIVADVQYQESVTSNKASGRVDLIYDGLEKAGPRVDGSPYYFCIYGSAVVESNNRPSSALLSFEFDCCYGYDGFNGNRQQNSNTANLSIVF